jgi:hypothetical protein
VHARPAEQALGTCHEPYAQEPKGGVTGMNFYRRRSSKVSHTAPTKPAVWPGCRHTAQTMSARLLIVSVILFLDLASVMMTSLLRGRSAQALFPPEPLPLPPAPQVLPSPLTAPCERRSRLDRASCSCWTASSSLSTSCS